MFVVFSIKSIKALHLIYYQSNNFPEIVFFYF